MLQGLNLMQDFDWNGTLDLGLALYPIGTMPRWGTILLS